MRRLLIFFFALFLLLVGILGTLGIYGYRTYVASGQLETTKNVIIPKGNVRVILKRLQDEHVLLDSKWNRLVFRISVWLTRKASVLHAAEFSFPHHVSIEEILKILRYGKPVQHLLVIPEGLTAYQITNLINSAPFLTGQITISEEGKVLPQTYAYAWGESREKLLSQMQFAMVKAVTVIWKNREHFNEVKTKQDLITLASIVEKETALKSERPLIARVFINRLHDGMRLQSDPTVIYALTGGKGNLGRKLTRKDWEVANPYNTYWIEALPPMPICSPGVAAMEAVAHPAEGNMLYFVANGAGGHNFSSSLTEHNHNISLLKKIHSEN